MLKKFISIKNVGRFKNSAQQGNPQLTRYTFVLGANGFGKTTICAVLRSLQSGDAGLLIGRKALGVTGDASVELLLDNGPTSFSSAGWTTTLPNLAIFDGTFVAQNVYSGEAVEIDHKRGLYRVIIGQEGVHLAEEDARLAGESRAKTSDITAAAKAIQPHVPTGMTLEQFLALVPDSDIDSKIAEQERTLEAVRQTSQIQARVALSEIPLPVLPNSLTSLLARTIDNIAENAEGQLANHLAAHEMETTGEIWLAEGMNHTSADTCPFCGQDIRDLPLITAYRAIFSDDYKALKASVENLKENIGQNFGEGTIGRLITLVEQNRGNVEFWQRYCLFDPAPLDPPVTLSDAVRGFGQAALSLLDRKASTPLEAVIPNGAFTASANTYAQIQAAVTSVNAAIQGVNRQIAAKKAQTGTADVKVAERELAHYRAVKKRHEAVVSQACADHIRLTAEKDVIDNAKAAVRTKLETHTKKVVKPYQQRINEYLDAFNAGFRIAEVKHTYPAGIATSSYQLVINSTAIDLGDGNTPHNRPSFKNTLSAGDRTTLALAFFLTYLERDAERAKKIVVFDDPFNNQDAFRRRQTIHEIGKVGRACTQVIVLSHDATFLKQLWGKAPAAERVAIQITDARSQGSKIQSVDLDKACQGRMASEVDDLQAYLSTGAGKALDLVKKMRVVLETHCRISYPAYFEPTDWLGDIVRKIREAGDDHPAKPLYDELDQINEYTATYHHGEDVADATTEQIDSDELTGFVRMTLRIVNAFQG